MVYLKQKGGFAMFAMQLRPEVLKRLREQYPEGTRVELIEMCDPYREMPPGLMGTVQMVDDAGGTTSNGTTVPRWRRSMGSTRSRRFSHLS